MILSGVNVSFARQKQVTTVIQKGHEAVVKAAEFTPDGKFLVTASRDQTLKIWEADTRREIRTLFGHDHTVNSLAISSDGELILSGSADGTARLWELSSGDLLLTTPGEKDFVTSVALNKSKGLFATGSYQPTVKIRDLNSGKLIREIDADPDRGLGFGVNIAFSPDGNMLAVGEDNKLLKVYRTDVWDTLYTLPVRLGSCGGCATFPAFSRDGKLIAKAVNGGALTLHDALTGKQLYELKEKINDLRAVDFNHDDTRLMIATEKSVYQYDVSTGQLLNTFEPEVKEINHAAFHPEESVIVVSGNDHKASTFQAGSGSMIGQFSGILQEQDRGGIDYDPDNYWQSHLARYVRLKSKVLLSSKSGQLIRGKFGTLVKSWEMRSGNLVREYRGHEKAALALALSQDEKTLVTGDGDGKVIIWDVDTGDSLSVFERHNGPVWDIQFSHDQNKIVTVSWDGHAHVRDVASGKLISDVYFGNRSAYSVSFSPNDLYIIAGLLDKKLEMFEIATGTSVREFIGPVDVVSEIHTLPEENRFVTVSWDGSTTIWDIGTGLMSAKYSGDRALHAAMIDPTKKRIYVAGADRNIYVLNMDDLAVQSTLTGHQSAITSLQADIVKGLLISTSLDGVTKIWDVLKGSEFFEHIHIGKKDWMVKTRSGYFNATEGARRVIHFVKGNKTYAADQFFDTFYRPELIPDLFAIRGSGSLHDGIREKLNKFPPPEIKLAIRRKDDPSQATLYLKVFENKGGFDRLRLFHNGKRLDLKLSEVESGSDKTLEHVYTANVPLIGGKNVFGAVAISEGGTESALIEKEVFSEQKKPSTRCYVLAIGINDYQNNALDLNYARSDAESFVASLQENTNSLFNDVEITTLYDQDASQERILSALDEIAAKAGINDLFVFYYAGHGSVVDSQFFFIPTETSRLYDIRNLRKTALSAEALQAKFRAVKALKQVIIMDACQSGGSAELLAQRGAVEEKAIAQLSRSAGIHVLASAGSDQYASEFSELQHGLFTYVLLKALDGEADGAPEEGKVTLYELKSYLDDQVPDMSMKYKGTPQYPYTFSKGNDFPLKVIREN